jgi:type II secretory pathway pseudopilin PulG
LLVSLVAPRYFGAVSKSEEAALKQSLYVMRDAIDKFYSDHERYPEELRELVSMRYLRAIPVDPYTQRADSWVLVAPQTGIKGKVFDVRSGALVRARDGTEVARW